MIWDWQPPYSNVLHKLHTCGSHEPDSDTVHKCRDCECWVTDAGLEVYKVREIVPEIAMKRENSAPE